MGVISVNWDSSFTATSLNATAITTGATNNTAAIDNDGQAGTEISVTIAYLTSIVQGAVVYVLRMVDDTPTFEGVADSPWGFNMPYAASTTFHRTFVVPGDRVSQFKVLIYNPNSTTLTATVKYKQFTVQLA